MCVNMLQIWILHIVFFGSTIYLSQGYSVAVYTDNSYTFFPVNSQVITIGIQTKGYAEILLCNTPDLVNRVYYNISIGCTDYNENNNGFETMRQWILIEKNGTTRAKTDMKYGTLSDSQINNFTICWDDTGYIAVGQPGEWYPHLLWKDYEVWNYRKIQYIGIRATDNNKFSRSLHAYFNRYNNYEYTTILSNILSSWTINFVPELNFLEGFIKNFHPNNGSILSTMSQYYRDLASHCSDEKTITTTNPKLKYTRNKPTTNLPDWTDSPTEDDV